MKIALYIEDGLEQIALTPESETEKSILGKLHDGTRELTITKGSFFKVRGGWVRHGVYSPADDFAPYGGRKAEDDESTMIMLQKPKVPEPGAPS